MPLQAEPHFLVQKAVLVADEPARQPGLGGDVEAGTVPTVPARYGRCRIDVVPSCSSGSDRLGVG